MSSPEYHVLLGALQEGSGCNHRFDSMIEDYSGKCLIEYLLAQEDTIGICQAD